MIPCRLSPCPKIPNEIRKEVSNFPAPSKASLRKHSDPCGSGEFLTCRQNNGKDELALMHSESYDLRLGANLDYLNRLQ